MNRTKEVLSTPVFLILTALLVFPLAALAQDPGVQVEPMVAEEAAPEPAAPTAPENLTPPADAETTASGLAYKVLSEGTGTEKADGNDLAVVHYTGWVSETGEVFATSTGGHPQLLPLEALIDGWTEGLQLMPEGAEWRLWIPGELAYQGVEGRPQGMLVFDVEVLEVRHIPDVPANLAAAPADAETGRNGLAWQVLEDGSGEGSPGPGDTVKVHYIGWNGEGKWFDSSYSKGTPAVLEFNELIDGWKQALRDMVPGEKRRLWVPGSLAYADDPAGPQGLLVFEVELIEINPAPEEDAG